MPVGWIDTYHKSSRCAAEGSGGDGGWCGQQLGEIVWRGCIFMYFYLFLGNPWLDLYLSANITFILIHPLSIFQNLWCKVLILRYPSSGGSDTFGMVAILASQAGYPCLLIAKWYPVPWLSVQSPCHSKRDILFHPFFSHGFLSDLLKLVSRSKTHSLQTLPKTMTIIQLC